MLVGGYFETRFVIVDAGEGAGAMLSVSILWALGRDGTAEHDGVGLYRLRVEKGRR